MSPMLSISEDQVRRLADADAVIRAIRAAFTRDYSKTLCMPVRSSLELSGGAVLLLMPCYDSDLGLAGVKTVTVSPQSGVHATYELVDPVAGRALARIEANWLTDLRTAATSALATDLLARPHAETLGVFGTGRQAVAHLTVLPRVRNFRRYLACGSGRSDLKQFCADMAQQLGMKIEPADAEVCAGESDVLCTCTTSPVPLFDGRSLRPGVHLNLVGAFQPHTREVDHGTVKRARVVVDNYDGALSEAGDLLIPLANGSIARDHVIADLHQIASGKKPGRTREADITLFKSVGCALEDLVTADLVYRRVKAGNG
jgi:ornithine cyclodeaminase/alanine dehydrogenase-like protein (mu-crystallin family)